MSSHGTDSEWESFAQEDPYWAVLTQDRFKKENLSAEARAESIAKLGICIEEADECGYWLELIIDGIIPSSDLRREVSRRFARHAGKVEERPRKLWHRSVAECADSGALAFDAIVTIEPGLDRR